MKTNTIITDTTLLNKTFVVHSLQCNENFRRVNVTVKFGLEQATKTKRGSRGIALKLKCTLVQALRLCTGRTAYRGSRGIALL
jgi:hypothetical protein